jgi:hypothetical protein
MLVERLADLGDAEAAGRTLDQPHTQRALQRAMRRLSFDFCSRIARPAAKPPCSTTPANST